MHHMGHVFDSKFSNDVSAVSVHRMLTNAELNGYLTGIVSFRNHLHDLNFTRGNFRLLHGNIWFR